MGILIALLALQYGHGGFGSSGPGFTAFFHRGSPGKGSRSDSGGGFRVAFVERKILAANPADFLGVPESSPSPF